MNGRVSNKYFSGTQKFAIAALCVVWALYFIASGYDKQIPAEFASQKNKWKLLEKVNTYSKINAYL